jgi:peptide/nickel transport system substrate-binding protein
LHGTFTFLRHKFVIAPWWIHYLFIADGMAVSFPLTSICGNRYEFRSVLEDSVLLSKKIRSTTSKQEKQPYYYSEQIFFFVWGLLGGAEYRRITAQAVEYCIITKLGLAQENLTGGIYMRKLQVLLLTAVAVLVLLAVPALAAVEYSTKGPNADEIYFIIITEDEARLRALQLGEIHIYPGLTTPETIDTIYADLNMDITFDLGFHMFYTALNMRKKPLDDKVVRQALAHVVARDRIINTLFAGYMLPLESFVPQSSPFHHDDVKHYEYSPRKAAAMLDAAGYTMGPGGIRIDPATNKPMEEIEFLTPTFEIAPSSAQIGQLICDEARAIGIPAKHVPLDFNIMLDRLDIFDFDAYCLAWGLDRDPTFLYHFFHSSMDVKSGNNTPGIRDPELDQLLDTLYYAATYDEAMEASKEAQEMLSDLLPYITLYSRPYIDAFRTDKVKGYVPMLGYGAANYSNNWTTLNIAPVTDQPIRWLLPEDVKTLNPTVANSAYDWEILGRTTDSLMAVDPETMEDIPWVATGWEIETWKPNRAELDPECFANVDDEATKITFHLRDDVKFNDGMPFTAKDVKFSIDYYIKHQLQEQYQYLVDVVKVETPDDYTVVVYMSTLSYWHLGNLNRYWLPEHIWKNVEDPEHFQPWLEPHPTVEGLTQLVGIGPFMLESFEPGQYIHMVRNPYYWAAQ